MSQSDNIGVDLSALDRPVWSALTHFHAEYATGDDLARRYRPAFNMFACARDDSEAAIATLTEVIAPGQSVYMMQAVPIKIADPLMFEMTATAVQMTLEQPVAMPVDTSRFMTLGDADVPEMLELTALTKPGPFCPQTHQTGLYWGIRIDGRLAAMAGERMRFPGFTEVSAVCSHPDFRGLGLARDLSAFVAAGIQARGDIPFLHAWKTNTAARSLYYSLGFSLRCEMHAAVVTRP
tara:strand:+ start:1288 stop:1995 length:708 start_codon:yes stop_codon:yes gene_type:complete